MADDEAIWPDALFSDLDRNGPMPIYHQVASRLEAAIHSGEVPAGARLVNEIEIGRRLSISRPTVRRAIQSLVDKGLLVRRRGIGTQVVQGQFTRKVELTSLYEDLQISSHAPSTKVLKHERRPAPADVAEHLGVPAGSELLYLRRQRFTDGVPVALLENWLPLELDDISRDALEQRGLYQILRGRGVTIRVAKQRIGARRERADEASLLDINSGSPLLTMERTAYDASGRAIEFGHHCYRPDMYSFETTVVAK